MWREQVWTIMWKWFTMRTRWEGIYAPSVEISTRQKLILTDIIQNIQVCIKLDKHLNIWTSQLNDMKSSGQKHYTCSTCGKSYRFWGGVDDCQRRHEKNLRYTCEKEGCGKGFNSKFRFQLHLRTHDGQRPFQGCGKRNISISFFFMIIWVALFVSSYFIQY